MTSKSLFRPADREEILARIALLRPDSPRQWGKMDPAQMMAHCQVALRTASGEHRIRRALVGVLFGSIARRSLSGPKPFRRNLPTDKSFRITDPRDFARERDALVVLVRSFGERGAYGLTKDPHPFFGALRTEEWEALMWKHLDHHLRQFSA